MLESIVFAAEYKIIKLSLSAHKPLLITFITNTHLLCTYSCYCQKTRRSWLLSVWSLSATGNNPYKPDIWNNCQKIKFQAFFKMESLLNNLTNLFKNVFDFTFLNLFLKLKKKSILHFNLFFSGVKKKSHRCSKVSKIHKKLCVLNMID